jgi:hypothetical protein
VCRRPNCPLTRRAKQRMGQIDRGSDCHSQRLDPLLRGRTERFGCGRTGRPLWGRIVSIWKRLWGESLQCRMVPLGVSQCLNGGRRNCQGTGVCSAPAVTFFPSLIWGHRCTRPDRRALYSVLLYSNCLLLHKSDSWCLFTEENLSMSCSFVVILIHSGLTYMKFLL